MERAFSRRLGLGVVIALLAVSAVTFFILMGLTPIEPSDAVVTVALAINSVLVIALAILIGREVAGIVSAFLKGKAAGRLHFRIIGLFCLVAAIPAILVAIIASITLNIGLDRWFEVRTRQIVGSSLGIARAYMDESRRVLTGNTLSMAFDLDRARPLYNLDRGGFQNLLNLQARGRGLIGAQILRRDGRVVMQAEIDGDVNLPSAFEESFEAADTGDPVSIPPGRTNFIGAMFKLREIPDAYLYTIMPLRPEVTGAMRQMEANMAEYSGLESNRFRFQLTFAVLYIGVCLVVLLAAIWLGISVANRIVSPIRRLIYAADAVSAGDLDVRVGIERRAEGDLRNLSHTFNTMLDELKTRNDEVLRAKDDIDRRARFIEALLSGVSAAVIGVNRDRRVTIANTAASSLLLRGKADGEGEGDIEVVGTSRRLPRLPVELVGVLDRARSSGRPEYREQITLRRGGDERTLNVQVTQEQDEEDEADGDASAGVGSDDSAADGIESPAAGGSRDSAGIGSESERHSFVITIDDITDLVVAQRNTAWSDVARRIAHEIKNPLTPIQLSAERLRRRYGKFISEDREVFDQCTDTIIRQVGDIGRMVDEFSSFARMPKPELKATDLSETISEALFLQKVAHPDIEFVSDLADEELMGLHDVRLLSQAFINVIKNAVEAIESKGGKEADRGRIIIRSRCEGDWNAVSFIDNGKGFPERGRHLLLEPYNTTREKGTGLGLAIVRKIVEDHGGRVELLDSPRGDGGSGAMVRLFLPRERKPESKPKSRAGAKSKSKPGRKRNAKREAA